MEQAQTSHLPDFVNFVRVLERDEAAVRAALTYEWSNGQTEGQINRLKFLKRQMVRRVTHQGIAPAGSQNWKECFGVI